MPINIGLGPDGLSLGFGGGGTNASSDRYFQENMMRQQMQKAIQWRVRDARKAGINPLFALGAQVGPSAGASPTGQPPGGSAVKASIRAVSRTAEAQARKDEAIARYYDSLVARGAYDANTTQDQEGNIITRPSSQLPPLPSGEAKTIPLAQRPKRNTPKISSPEYMEAVGEKGRRKVLNPDLNMDELNQVLYVADLLGEVFSSNFRWLKDKAKFNAGRGMTKQQVHRRWLRKHRHVGR